MCPAEDLADRVTAGRRLAREARETADGLAVRAPVPDGEPAREQRVAAEQETARPVEQDHVIVEVPGRGDDVDRSVAEVERGAPRRPVLEPEEPGDLVGADGRDRPRRGDRRTARRPHGGHRGRANA